MTRHILTGFAATLGLIALVALGLVTGAYLRDALRPPSDLPIAEASGQIIGGVTYHGVTASSYTGSLGGYYGATAKCSANYPQSHMCTQGEMLASGVTSIGTTGWVACDLGLDDVCLGVIGTAYSGTADQPCTGYSSASGALTGATISATGDLSWQSCSTSTPIHCCS